MQAFTFHTMKNSPYAANPFASQAPPSGNRFSGLVQPLALSEAEKATDKTPPRVSFQLTQADKRHATKILSLLPDIIDAPLAPGDTVTFEHRPPTEQRKGSLRSSQVTYTHDGHTQTASLLPGPALQLVSLLLKADKNKTQLHAIQNDLPLTGDLRNRTVLSIADNATSASGDNTPSGNSVYEDTLASLQLWVVNTAKDLLGPINTLFQFPVVDETRY